jgi:disulfide bond formation protein DsbB
MPVSETGVSPQRSDASSSAPLVAASSWTWAALTVAAAGLAGSLFLSLGMALKACPLCFYQRAFVMSVFAVLGVGLLGGARHIGRLSLFVLPPAVAGLGVALFHVYLEVTGKLECPAGLLEWSTAPKQSLGMFGVLVALLVVDVLRGPGAGVSHWPGLAGAILIGSLLAVASCTSNPPMPTPPKEPYAKPPDICRPPYRL